MTKENFHDKGEEDEKIQKEHNKYCDTELGSKVAISDPSLGGNILDSQMSNKSRKLINQLHVDSACNIRTRKLQYPSGPVC